MKLSYAQIIERDQRYTILADLGLRLSLLDTPKPQHLERRRLLARRERQRTPPFD